MLRFFRHIRKSFTEQNKIRTYLLYAIGEILLVVIGILIALQVNNWNEQRSREAKEIEILETFELELTSSLNRLNEILQYNRQNKNKMLQLEQHLSEQKPYTPGLDSLFFSSTSFTFGDQFSTVALDNLNSFGVDIIRNKELRSQLMRTYEAYPYLKEAQDIYTDIILTAGKTLLSTRFEELWEGDAQGLDNLVGVMHPVDYHSLLDDQEFLYFLRSLPNHMGYFVEYPSEFVKERIERSLLLIRQELNKQGHRLKTE